MITREGQVLALFIAYKTLLIAMGRRILHSETESLITESIAIAMLIKEQFRQYFNGWSTTTTN